MLVIEKSVADEFTNPGATVEYTIVVQNVGFAASLSTTLADTLPDGFTYTETGLATRGWDLGTVEPNESETVTYQVSVGSGVTSGNYVNIAIVSASNYRPVSDDATIEVRSGGSVLGAETAPVISIGKIGDKEFVNPGSSLTYTVTITNTGDAPAINLVITDTLPAGFTSAEGGLSLLTWKVLALEVGESWQESFLVNVGADVVAGQYENVVTAVADNYSGELRATYTVEVRKGMVLGLAPTGVTPRAIAFWLVAVLVFVLTTLGLVRTFLRVTGKQASGAYLHE